MTVSQRQGKQFPDTHTRCHQHQDNFRRIAVVGFQFSDIFLREDVLFFFYILRQAHKFCKVCRAYFLPDCPVRHLRYELLVLVHGGMSLGHVWVKYGLKVCGAEITKLFPVQRRKYAVGVVI